MVTAEVLVSTVGQSREEWLEYRKRGIGSSDAPVVAGLSPFSSPYRLFCEKRGLIAETPASEAMEWGNKLEDLVAHEFSQRTEIFTIKIGAILRSQRWPWMLANLDRQTGDGGVLEIKTTSAHMAGEWTDGPPEHVICQLQHQLAVTGDDHGWVAALIGGQRYVHFHIPRDDELIADLVELERIFWQRVLDDDPPPIDDSDATVRTIEELAGPGGDEEPVELPTRTVRELARYERAAARVKRWETVKAESANRLKAALGEHTAGTVDGVVRCTWRPTPEQPVSFTRPAGRTFRLTRGRR